MLKIQEIRELIKLIDKSSINEFKYENDGSKIVLKKNEAATVTYRTEEAPVQPVVTQAPPARESAPAAEPVKDSPEVQQEPKAEEDDSNLHKVVSPMVGTFYAASSPEDPPFVKPGDKVSKDSVVCIIEAMKLFNEIEAEVNGEIVKVLVENGQLVEYGQPLFLVKAE
ncbi:acetyl-CoA carboxylase biotin carboxyl carrier protein [Fictibacillus phosphorivorans]|uniref:acetyl-CoA carboxylase biotin carboxyl carrier protein n=1 Tax=Fictibacillus phosphorivorans TaxID=1221500 RepID=UPI00203FF506|nr:acetyl-CoA carboxylase biotin carboxyl carrier protein [Fictibacillus phosphorivorans]MCM3716756.1 acetyl-CoA carboxylase biotin carboxyl carrier protein [Fictibacillus phosphorivorans]MCM3774695.1 acetyl-CoA carboxylase biotin carboxyl carrier protein [Fictibacillus phosphorivorans]